MIRAKYGIPIPSGSSTEASLSLKEKYGLPSASENRMRADRERSDRESYDELLPSSTSLFNGNEMGFMHRPSVAGARPLAECPRASTSWALDHWSCTNRRRPVVSCLRSCNQALKQSHTSLEKHDSVLMLAYLTASDCCC